MRTLIVGAGIGGLCTALCLQKSGHEIQLFEQSAQITEVGGGLQLGANALRVLDYLGLLSQLEEVSVAPERVDFCSYRNGEVLHSVDLGHRYLAKYGAPYLHIHRADLQRILLQALQQTTKLELNARLRDYRQTDQGVNVELTDGRSFAGDCLIAADGIKSRVRASFQGQNEPVFTGNVAWRGTVPADDLPNDFMGKVVTNFVGPNKHMVVYYLRKQQLLNFVAVVEDATWSDDSWVSKAPWQKLKDDFSGWHKTVQIIVDAMQEQDCYRWALYAHKPFKPWGSERVALLGDAAHATLPFLASGAAMGIEDARVLQRALDQSNNIEEGLQLYQCNRFDRTAKIQKLSSKMAKLYHIKHPVLLKLAFNAVKLKSAVTEEFLTEYDANTVTLV